MKILNRFTNEVVLEVETLRSADLSSADLSGADLRYSHGIYTMKLNEHLIIHHKTSTQIGCRSHSLNYWIKNYKEIGKEEEYPEETIKLYGSALRLLKKMEKLNEQF